MKLDQIKNSHLNYSTNAIQVLEKVDEKKIDIQDFEKWIKEKVFIVGSGHVMQYLIENGLRKDEIDKLMREK